MEDIGCIGLGDVTVWDTRSTLDRRIFSGVDREKIGEALSSGRIVRLGGSIDLYVYIGRNDDYLMIPRTYCSCKGFLMNTIIESTRTHCSHLAALEVAGRDRIIDLSERLDPFDIIEIILEILESGRSNTLRKIIYS